MPLSQCRVSSRMRRMTLLACGAKHEGLQDLWVLHDRYITTTTYSILCQAEPLQRQFCQALGERMM